MSRTIFQVISLNAQLTYFKNVEKLLRQKLGDEAAKKTLSEAVYLISIGTNDYLSPFFRNSTVLQSSQKQNVHIVIGNLTVVIKVTSITYFISKTVSFFHALSL